MKKRKLLRVLLLGTIFIITLAPLSNEALLAANNFADPAFSSLWSRTDELVANGLVSRTFLWGPTPGTPGLMEDYADSPGGKRLVQYFDKSRMEINNPNGNAGSPNYVSNGLITRELMSGRLQIGDKKFEPRESALIGLAGDPDDTSGPTYKAFNRLTTPAEDNTGLPVAGSVDREGATRFDVGDFGKKYAVSYQYYEPQTGHNIAGPFWAFLNQTGPIKASPDNVVDGRLFDPVYYATGLPLTEAYWASVKVGGQIKDVLIQAFERRILTFTPSNPPEFRVEMGNVGQHYYKWRYGSGEIGPGFIQGRIVAGPTCPVVRPDHICPPRAVPGRTIYLKDAPGTKVLQTLTTDADGSFLIRIMPGDYRLEVAPSGIQTDREGPHLVTVVSGQTTNVEILLDTGIR